MNGSKCLQTVSALNSKDTMQFMSVAFTLFVTMSIRCDICSKVTPNVKTHMQHIGLVHRSDPNIRLKCVTEGCPMTFSRYSSFISHVYRKHQNILKGKWITLELNWCGLQNFNQTHTMNKKSVVLDFINKSHNSPCLPNWLYMYAYLQHTGWTDGWMLVWKFIYSIWLNQWCIQRWTWGHCPT